MNKLRPRRAVSGFGIGAAILLVLAAMVGPSMGSPGETAAPSRVAIAAATPTLAPVPTPVASAAPTAEPPPTEQSPAPFYPLVDSCNPASVPGAIADASPSAAPGTFTLHVPILEYHRVVPLAQAGDSMPGLVVPPEEFAAQLDAFEKAGWHTITMAALADDLANRVRPPQRTFVMTFDDGWGDGYTYALPILRRHGFVGTFYVIAGRIDRPGFLTSEQLRELLAAGNEIGDHTFDHKSLSDVKPARVPFEVDAAAARIAQVTGRWPATLAYPYGGANNQVAGIVAACRVLRAAVLDGPMKVAEPPVDPGHGATPGPGKTVLFQAYESAANRFAIPRMRVGPGMTPTGLLFEMQRGAAG